MNNTNTPIHLVRPLSHQVRAGHQTRFRLLAGIALSALFLAFMAPASAADAPAIKISLVGDSTVTDTSGWGKALADLLTPNVEVKNFARGGQSTKSYLDQKLIPGALVDRPNYVFIQFGHNDMPGKGPNRETDPKTTYSANLITMIDEVRAAGAQPILVTSLVRRDWNRKDGSLIDGLLPYAEAMKAVAAEKKVPLIDLHASSLALVQKLGQKGADDIGPMTPKQTRDNTHLSPKGAALMAGLIVEELPAAVPALVPYIKK